MQVYLYYVYTTLRQDHCESLKLIPIIESEFAFLKNFLKDFHTGLVVNVPDRNINFEYLCKLPRISARPTALF